MFFKIFLMKQFQCYVFLFELFDAILNIWFRNILIGIVVWIEKTMNFFFV